MKSQRDMPSDFASFLGRRKAFVDINPRYDLLLKNQGLTAPEHFLSLPAIIVSGHPDRHVTRVSLGAGPDSINAFLKKEHRVAWRDRLANALAGFGFCSKSHREGVMLRTLRQCGIGGPEFVAAGEGGQGRAFLLVRELEGGVDLRCFLANRGQTRYQRPRIAKALGETLARMHNAGFEHGDLYSKHILVGTRTEINILDWQRSRRRSHVPWGRRWRDLATLDATLAEDWADSRERLACLHAYLKGALGRPASRPFFLQAARAIRRQSLRLLRRRKIREMRRPPLAEASQQLIWLKGEELCVTREFLEATAGRMPELFTMLITSKASSPQEFEEIIIPGGATTLALGRSSLPFRWLWTWISRRRDFSSEQQKAAIIFRLERYGVRTPRLLAFGQRLVAWRTESFLLTKNLEHTTPLPEWLCHHFGSRKNIETKQGWAMLREAGTLFRRMHEAQCYFHGTRKIPVEVAAPPEGAPSVVLASLDGICKRRRPSRAFAMKDLKTFVKGLASARPNRSDRLRFLLAYLGERRLTSAAKHLIRRYVSKPQESGIRNQEEDIKDCRVVSPVC